MRSALTLVALIVTVFLQDVNCQPSRILHFISNITQADTICGEITRDLMWIELNEEPGTNKQITVDVHPSVTWARFWIGKNIDEQLDNYYQWQEYVKRVDLRIPVDLELHVPGCLPATSFSVRVVGKYSGDICNHAECPLEFPAGLIELTTSNPRKGKLIIEDFVVIPGKWSKVPVKLMIENPLLVPEVLIVKPKSLLNDAIIFSAQHGDFSQISEHKLHNSDIKFTWSRKLFPTTAYMYVYGRKDLAMGSELQVQFYLQCDECKYNLFFPELDKPIKVKVGFENKQRFVPIYMPTMMTMHKYCYNLKLNKKAMIDVKVLLQVKCSAFRAEPKAINFKTKGDLSIKSQFCITPFIPDESCNLEFFLTGEGAYAYHKPQPILMYSVDYKQQLKIPMKRFHFEPIIETTNRKWSKLYRFYWDISEGVDMIIVPTDINGYFSFNPEKFVVSHLLDNNIIEFMVYPNVDCPLKIDNINISVYWVVNFNISSDRSIYKYVKPHPLYIKVIENTKELNPRMEWCHDRGINCDTPPQGITCIPDPCAIDYNQKGCKPKFIGYPPKQYGLREYTIAGSISLILLYIILRQLGCIGKPELPEIDEEKEIKEKKMFNTAENLREAQVAIENLLWQIHKYEQNLDIGKKYQRDIFRNDDYWDE